MSYYNENYHSNSREYDLNHQNIFEDFHYGSKFSSNYGTNSYNTDRGQLDLNRFLSNRSCHSNHYGSNYATTSYDTNHGRSDVNMLNNWSSNGNSNGLNNDTGPDLNMFLNNRSSYGHSYGSDWGTDSYITNHGKSDVTMLNNRSLNSHKWGSNSYHKTNNGKSDFNKFSSQRKYKSNSSSSSEIVNAKNNIEEDSDDSHEDNLGEDDSFAKPQLPKALIDRFPQHVKILNELVYQKSKLRSPISYFKIQEMSEINGYCNEEKENEAFLNSLPSNCHTLHLRKPLEHKSSKIIKHPLPLIKITASVAIKVLLSKRDEGVIIRETWKVLSFFLIQEDYSRRSSGLVWGMYHALFRIVHCDLKLNGEYYCMILQEILNLIKNTRNGASIKKGIYPKVSAMYDKIADPPLDELGSLLVLAWRYLKDKKFVCFGTVSEIRKAREFMEYKLVLHSLEFKLGKAGVVEVMSFIDNERIYEESHKSSGQDKFVKNSEILNNGNSTKILRHDKLVKKSKVSSNEHSNKYFREDKSVRNSVMSDGVESSNNSKFPRGRQISTENLQNLSQKRRRLVNLSVENLQNLPKKRRHLVYTSANSSENLKIDKSNISNLYNVIRIKQGHDRNDLEYKNTQFFPLPLSKNRTTALKELLNIFETTREEQIIQELRESLVVFVYSGKGKREFRQIWNHYHRLSKLIYIDLGLGKGPLYVERLQKIISDLQQGQFESIPNRIYFEMTEAYKAFADSSYEEIETLLFLAAEYLEGNNIKTPTILRNQVIPNEYFSKLRKDIQNYPRNLQILPKNQKNVVYLSANASDYQEIDKSKLCSYPHVILIKQRHNEYDLKGKNTNIFPLPISKIRATALNELAKIFEISREVEIISHLKNMLLFFFNSKSKRSLSYVWQNYHRLSKYIYIDLGLGKGPAYVDRLLEILEILEKGQFEIIPEEIYDELIKAYKVFSDSCDEEIETLLLLAVEYLEENIKAPALLRNQVFPSEDFSKLRKDIQNYPRNLQILPKNRENVVYLSASASENREIDKSKLCSYPNVILIKQRHDEYDLKRKNTYTFPLPISKIRATALNELAKILEKSRVKIISELRDMLLFFSNSKSKRGLSYVWKNYHRLSKYIYIDLGLGKGPAYVDRLLEIIEILKKEQFEILPEEIYDELIKAYKVFSDSCNEEIETLLLLAMEYLEDNNVFI